MCQFVVRYSQLLLPAFLCKSVDKPSLKPVIQGSSPGLYFSDVSTGNGGFFLGVKIIFSQGLGRICGKLGKKSVVL